MTEKLETLSRMLNKTGLSASPKESSRMMDVTKDTCPSMEGSATTADAMRMQYARETEPLGTVPVPNSFKGIAQTALQRLKGEHLEVFMDEIGERLAFERTGTRLYDLLLLKCEARPDEAKFFSPIELRKYRDEELGHFQLLAKCVESMGADPTAVTPCADASGVMAQGILQVLSDPRTSLAQCLMAIQLAELADNDGWQLLIKLAREFKLDSLAADFETAYIQEQRHLEGIRKCHNDCVFGAAQRGVLS